MDDVPLEAILGGASQGEWALSPGDEIGGCEVLRPIGRGGIGEVYEARHIDLGTEFALKVVQREKLGDPASAERFEQEAGAAARLEHPNILRVVDFGQLHDLYYIRMQLARGVSVAKALGPMRGVGAGGAPGDDVVRSLADLFDAVGGRLPEEVAAEFALGMLEGLGHAHARGVVHGGVKPGNVLLFDEGDRGVMAKVSDFGLAPALGEHALSDLARISERQDPGPEPAGVSESRMSLIETYAYMSPEQRRGEEARFASDVYAAGLVIRGLLAGPDERGRPVPGGAVEGLAPRWNELLRRALDVDPARRFAVAGEMLAEFLGARAPASPFSGSGPSAPEGTPGGAADPVIAARDEAGVPRARLADMAGDEGPLAAAREAFRAGDAAFQAGRAEEALDLFARSKELFESVLRRKGAFDGCEAAAKAAAVEEEKARALEAGRYSPAAFAEAVEAAEEARRSRDLGELDDLRRAEELFRDAARSFGCAAESAREGWAVGVQARDLGEKASSWRHGDEPALRDTLDAARASFAEGEEHLEKGNPDKAVSSFEAARKAYDEAFALEDAVDDCDQAAQAARSGLDAVTPEAEKLAADNVAEARRLRGEADDLRQSGKFADARDSYEKASGLLKSARTKTADTSARLGSAREEASGAIMRRLAPAAYRRAQELEERSAFDEAADAYRAASRLARKRAVIAAAAAGAALLLMVSLVAALVVRAARAGARERRLEQLAFDAKGVLENRREATASMKELPYADFAEADRLRGLAEAALAAGDFERASTLFEQADGEWKSAVEATRRLRGAEKSADAERGRAESLLLEAPPFKRYAETEFGDCEELLERGRAAAAEFDFEAALALYSRAATTASAALEKARGLRDQERLALDAKRVASDAEPEAKAFPRYLDEQIVTASGLVKEADAAFASMRFSEAHAAYVKAADLLATGARKARQTAREAGDAREGAIRAFKATKSLRTYSPSSFSAVARKLQEGAEVLDAEELDRALALFRTAEADIRRTVRSVSATILRALRSSGDLKERIELLRLLDRDAVPAEFRLERTLAEDSHCDIKAHGGKAFAVAVSPDGRRFGTAGADGCLNVWDLGSGEKLRSLRPRGRSACSFDFSPDGASVAVGCDVGGVRIHDAATGRLRKEIPGHRSAVRSVEFSRDGKLIATGSDDRTAALWDASSGRREKAFSGPRQGHKEAVGTVSLSPDGRYLATGSLDGTAAVWDASSRRKLGGLRAGGEGVACVDYSPDGKLLAVAAGVSVHIWDPDTSRTIRTLGPHGGAVTSVAFSADGRRLVAAGRDGTALIWDVATGELVAKLSGHGGAVTSAAFSPKAPLVLTTCEDGTARVWYVPKGANKPSD